MTTTGQMELMLAAWGTHKRCEGERCDHPYHLLAEVGNLKSDVSAAEQRALAAEAAVDWDAIVGEEIWKKRAADAEARLAATQRLATEWQLKNDALRGQLLNQHAEIVRLNQQIVDGDATIMTQGEEIEQAKAVLSAYVIGCHACQGTGEQPRPGNHPCTECRQARAVLGADTVAALTKARRLAEYDQKRQRP